MISYLVKNESLKYASTEALREALKLFDFDADGKIKMDEFEYFMRNFGEDENSIHMSEERLLKLFDQVKPLDANGNVEIEKVVQLMTSEWPKK